MGRKYFGTDGIRGHVGQFPITPDFMLKLGWAAGMAFRKHGKCRILIGKDTRISGYMFESALQAGLSAAGADVLLLGPMPTPAVAYLTRTFHADAGIVISASHNPHHDNGIKFFSGRGTKLPDEVELMIEELLDTPMTVVESAQLGKASRINDAAGRYIEFCKSSVPTSTDFSGMKIVLDCGNGAAYSIAPLIFRELGAEVITTGIDPDGLNINDGCGALHPETAGALVRQHNADLGVSFDGDADRVIFTDAAGQVVSGDRVLGLCAIGLKDQGRLKKDTLVVTVMSNLGLIEAMKKQGIKVETTAVGDRSVIECIRKNGYSFGGENSGHLIFAEHSTTGDGIMSALQIIRLMKERGATLAQLSSVMQEYPTQLVNLPTKSKPAISSLKKLNALMDEATGDFGDQGRHLIRYSGTENKIRVLVEHRDAGQVERWVSRFTDAIKEEIG